MAKQPPPELDPTIAQYYHETSEEHRLEQGPFILEEARTRELIERHARRPIATKPGGQLFAAAISRWASALDGLARDLFQDPRFATIVERDLREGQHRNPTERLDYFTTAYFHRPDELRAETLGAGLIIGSSNRSLRCSASARTCSRSLTRRADLSTLPTRQPGGIFCQRLTMRSPSMSTSRARLPRRSGSHVAPNRVR